MPLFMPATFYQLKPWLDKPIETDGLFGGNHYDWISIDPELQAAGRGG